MAQEQNDKAAGTVGKEAFKALPNATIDFEEAVLTDDTSFMGAGTEVAGTPLSAADANTAAMLRVAESMERIVSRQEATRQLSINEVLPNSPWNPEGKRVRAKFSRPTFLHGIDLNSLTLFEEEIELFNQLKPGRYIDRKVEVRLTQDGSIDLSWPGAKNDARIEMYSRFPTLASLLKAVIAERKAKEDRRRRGVFDDSDSLSD